MEMCIRDRLGVKSKRDADHSCQGIAVEVLHHTAEADQTRQGRGSSAGVCATVSGTSDRTSDKNPTTTQPMRSFMGDASLWEIKPLLFR